MSSEQTLNKWGVFDVRNKIWAGDEEKPLEYDVRSDAEAAAAALSAASSETLVAKEIPGGTFFQLEDVPEKVLARRTFQSGNAVVLTAKGRTGFGGLVIDAGWLRKPTAKDVEDCEALLLEESIVASVDSWAMDERGVLSPMGDPDEGKQAASAEHRFRD